MELLVSSQRQNIHPFYSGQTRLGGYCPAWPLPVKIPQDSSSPMDEGFGLAQMQKGAKIFIKFFFFTSKSTKYICPFASLWQ